MFFHQKKLLDLPNMENSVKFRKFSTFFWKICFHAKLILEDVIPSLTFSIWKFGWIFENFQFFLKNLFSYMTNFRECNTHFDLLNIESWATFRNFSKIILKKLFSCKNNFRECFIHFDLYNIEIWNTIGTFSIFCNFFEK